MKCPKCSSQMEQVSHHGIDAQRCTHCEGIWFESRKHDKLARLTRSEQIDTGSHRLGKEYDRVDHITCPDCGTPMVRMVDSTQSHIHYESCTVCGGVFFDAGEYSDYKRRTPLDFLRDLITGERD